MKKLQYKLFQTLLLTSTLPLIIVAALSLDFLGDMALHNARQRVDNNLKLARGIYESVLDRLKYVVRDQNRRIYSLVADDQLDLLRNEYAKVIAKNRFDFFVITDNRGKVLISMSNPRFEGADYSRDPYVRRVLLKGQLCLGTEILDAQELAALGLEQKARIQALDELRGMVIKTSMPLINNNEVLVGTVTAGYLLNNNNDIIIDPITKGTDFIASLFLRDIRICSNLARDKAVAVLGTRLSSAASREILENKSEYIGRVQVSGRGYLAGYAPLTNLLGEVIGAIGVGIPEKSIFELRDSLTRLFVLAVACSALLAFLIGLLNGATTVSAVNKLRYGIEAFGRGNYTHRIKINSRDELQELGEFFNKTMEQLHKTQKQLDACSLNIRSLETKVMQSTQELEAAQKKLVEYERMAAMGRMATAVSHELRNVFAEIQTSTYNLKSKATREYPQLVEYLQGIESSLAHASEIISKVLKFSYPSKLVYSDVDVNYLIADLLEFASLQAQFKRSNIRVVKELDPNLQKVKADGLQLREALLNLVTNAVQAMPDGGKLAVITQNDQSVLRIKIVDTGLGMSEQTRDNLFTPFFTTKSRGLGLGLCITKAIIDEHGGSLTVQSELNRGSTFLISLPASQTPQGSKGFRISDI